MTDNFNTFTHGPTAPIRGGAAITPHDTNDLSETTRAIYVGVSGDVKINTADGDTITFVGLAAGIIHPIRASRVYSTGTDATDILGLV